MIGKLARRKYKGIGTNWPDVGKKEIWNQRKVKAKRLEFYPWRSPVGPIDDMTKWQWFSLNLIHFNLYLPKYYLIFLIILFYTFHFKNPETNERACLSHEYLLTDELNKSAQVWISLRCLYENLQQKWTWIPTGWGCV